MLNTNSLEKANDYSAVCTHGRDSELCFFLSSLRHCVEHGRGSGRVRTPLNLDSSVLFSPLDLTLEECC